MPRKKLRDPVMPLYVADWISSEAVGAMSAAEERGFLRLLIHAWLSGSCSLRDDDDSLAALSLLGSKWHGPSGEKLRRCFVKKRIGSETKLVNRKQLEVWKERRSYAERGKRGGLSTAAARRYEVQQNASKPASKTQANGHITSSSSLTSSSSSKRTTPLPDFLRKVRPGMLRSVRQLLEFADAAVASGDLAPSEQVRYGVVALAVRAKKQAKSNPTGLFVTMVAEGSWPHANDAEMDEAVAWIKEHERRNSQAGTALAAAGVDLSKVGRSVPA